MENFDVIQRIKDLCREREYSFYELAKRSEIPYSTLNTMMLKSNSPTLPTLLKLCNGFGISLLQFFDPESFGIELTERQKECLTLFDVLTPEEQALVLSYMKGMLHRL